MSVIVKICGVTRPEDAEVAAALGADWIGLNFWPRSRRYLDPATAARVAAAIPGEVKRVGVFVNFTARRVEEIVRQLGLHLVQFHGDEDPEYVRGFAGRCVRALRLGDPTDLLAIESFDGADTVLLDAPSDGYGGSGKLLDWSLARQAKRFGKRVILAGGLDPENVGQAVAEVRPFGVDVASGVESSPGVKDEDKMRRFIEAAKGEAS